MAKFICQLRRGTANDWRVYEDSKYIQTKKYYVNTTYYLDKNGTLADPQPTKIEVESGLYYIKNSNYVPPKEGELVLEYDETYDGNGNLIKRVPRLKIGTGIDDYSALPYMSIDSFVMPKPNTITLYGGDFWTLVPGTTNEYYQDITEQLSGKVTPNSKIDLQPTPEQLSVFHQKDVAFTVVNEEDNTIRVYAVGIKPTNDYGNIQVTITEVATND